MIIGIKIISIDIKFHYTSNKNKLFENKNNHLNNYNRNSQY